MYINLFNTKVGLVPAAVKGVAHIGVLKAIEEANIKIDYLAGIKQSCGFFYALTLM